MIDDDYYGRPVRIFVPFERETVRWQRQRRALGIAPIRRWRSYKHLPEWQEAMEALLELSRKWRKRNDGLSAALLPKDGKYV